MRKIKVTFYSNGNTTAFKDGAQVPELQIPWFLLYIQELVRQGVDPTEVEFVMPSGPTPNVINVSGDVYSWSFENWPV